MELVSYWYVLCAHTLYAQSCATLYLGTGVQKNSRKIFANGMHWRNWQKFSPGENSTYTVLHIFQTKKAQVSESVDLYVSYSPKDDATRKLSFV